jgi:cell division protein FtsQ
LAALLPSWRAIIVVSATLLVAAGVYVGARESSLFAIDRIEVRGLPSGAAERVRAALTPLSGSSLVSFDATDGDRRLASVPIVASATYDRAFPHTLVVTVVPEVPIALLRRGPDAWVVSESGRVLRRVQRKPLPALPRIWLPANADPLVGAVVADGSAATVDALTAMRAVRLPVATRSVRLEDKELSITLASGAEVRLGAPSQLSLKLAVTARILQLAPDAGFIDVSVPERAVASDEPHANSQVDG